MKLKQISKSFLCFTLGALAVFFVSSGVQFIQQVNVNDSNKLSFEQATDLIKTNQISEIYQQPTQLSLIDRNGKKYFVPDGNNIETSKESVLNLGQNKDIKIQINDQNFIPLFSVFPFFAQVFIFLVFGITVLTFILLLQLVIKNFRDR